VRAQVYAMAHEEIVALEARCITKRFGHVTAPDGASFEVVPGEVAALKGDNGAASRRSSSPVGATRPDEGTLEVDGAALEPVIVDGDRRSSSWVAWRQGCTGSPSQHGT
jgi:ABC-type sugar transport system ATPase subunit